MKYTNGAFKGLRATGDGGLCATDHGTVPIPYIHKSPNSALVGVLTNKTPSAVFF